MKSRILASLLLSLVFSFSALAETQFESADGASRLSLEDEVAQAHRRGMGLALFLNAYPVPVMTESLGLSLEYSLRPSIALAVGFMQAARFDNNQGSNGVGQRILNRQAFAGLKLFPVENQYGRLFTTLGYLQGTADSSFRPALKSRNAEQSDTYEGAFLGMGIRMQAKKFRTWGWVLDAALQYAPGEVKSLDYVQSAGTVQLETSLDYGIVPSLQIGAQF